MLPAISGCDGWVFSSLVIAALNDFVDSVANAAVHGPFPKAQKCLRQARVDELLRENATRCIRASAPVELRGVFRWCERRASS